MLNFTQKRRIFEKVKRLDIHENAEPKPNPTIENCSTVDNDIEDLLSMKTNQKRRSVERNVKPKRSTLIKNQSSLAENGW